MSDASRCGGALLLLVAVSCSATDAFGQEPVDAESLRAAAKADVARKQEAAVRRIRELEARRMRMPIEWLALDVEAATGAVTDAVMESKPVRRARIGDAALEQTFFGEESAAKVHDDLESRLRREVDGLEPLYGITPHQKQKLLLAGRGDIKR